MYLFPLCTLAQTGEKEKNKIEKQGRKERRK